MATFFVEITKLVIRLEILDTQQVVSYIFLECYDTVTMTFCFTVILKGLT